MKNQKIAKFVIILVLIYIALGVRFYISDLKVQQKMFSCPPSIDISKFNNMTSQELIEYSEKNCVRNRSKLDIQEVTTAVSMITLWLPLIIGQGFLATVKMFVTLIEYL